MRWAKYMIPLWIMAASILGIHCGREERSESDSISAFEDKTDGRRSDTWTSSAGDINGDCAPDLLSVDMSDDLVVYVNDGEGNFPEKILVEKLAPALSATAIADFDNDGREDIAYASSFSSQEAIAILYQTEPMKFTKKVILESKTMGREFSVLTGLIPFHMDNDGFLDLYVTLFNPSKLSDSDSARNVILRGRNQFSEYKRAEDLEYLVGDVGRYSFTGAVLPFVHEDGRIEFNKFIWDGTDWASDQVFVKNEQGIYELLDNTSVGTATMGIDYMLKRGELQVYTTHTGSEGAGLTSPSMWALTKDSEGKWVIYGTRTFEDLNSTISWGLNVIDADLDGDEDVFIANGMTNIFAQLLPQYGGRGKSHLAYYEQVDGQFVDRSGEMGPFFDGKVLSDHFSIVPVRSNDSLSLLVSPLYMQVNPDFQPQTGFARYLRAKTNRNNSLRFCMNSRDIGSVVELLLEDGTSRYEAVKSVRGIASTSPHEIEFGLGKETRYRGLVVHCVNGRTSRFSNSYPIDVLNDLRRACRE